MQAETASVHRRLHAQQAEHYRPRIRAYVESGALIPAVDYLDAQRQRAACCAGRSRRCWLDGDCLVLPTVSGPAPATDTTGDPTFQGPFSLLGLPAITIPAGLSEDGPAARAAAGRAGLRRGGAARGGGLVRATARARRGPARPRLIGRPGGAQRPSCSESRPLLTRKRRNSSRRSSSAVGGAASASQRSRKTTRPSGLRCRSNQPWRIGRHYTRPGAGRYDRSAGAFGTLPNGLR